MPAAACRKLACVCSAGRDLPFAALLSLERITPVCARSDRSRPRGGTQRATEGTSEDLAHIRDLRSQKQVPLPARRSGRVYNPVGRPHNWRPPFWSCKSRMGCGSVVLESRLHL
ncbi:hypothetical protein NDU88_002262 [Pleurodeles waltl]|uniref:Uncharacterized protein n=1 Tax=Pleurodeles waltl TaxID=8319 RepID=A0AAV7MS89_PLEWA|nr:hypothetical protein NDU88_002262 [Pleurodeles waltl]